MPRLTDLLRHRREPQATWQLHRFKGGEIRVWRLILRWKSVRIYCGTDAERLDLVEEHAFGEPALAAEQCRRWREGKEREGWLLVGEDDPSTGLRYWICEPGSLWPGYPDGVGPGEMLLIGARTGRVDLVSQSIEQRVDVTFRCPITGHTALELALAAGQADVVRQLQASGARLDPEPHPRRIALEQVAELAQAAADGDLGRVDGALEMGAQAQPDDPYSPSPLARAAAQGHAAVVRRLLDAGADPRCHGEWSALDHAVEGGHLEVVRVLLDAGCRPKDPCGDERSTLMTAAETGDLQIVDALLEAGADPNQQADLGTALEAAAAAGEDAIYARLAPLTSNRDALRKAERELPKGRRVRRRRKRADPRSRDAFWLISDADLEGLVALLGDGLSVDAAHEDGETLLSLACRFGRARIVEELLKRGADVERMPSETRKTPLQISIEEHFYGITGRLLAAGADPNRRGRKSSLWPLAQAALAAPFDRGAVLRFRFGRDDFQHEPWARDLYPVEQSHLQDENDPVLEAFGTQTPADVLRLLVGHGAAVDAVDSRGRTALMLICERNPSDAAERAGTLLDCGADPGVRDSAGKTALDHAAGLARTRPAVAEQLSDLLGVGGRTSAP